MATEVTAGHRAVLNYLCALYVLCG